MPFGFSYDGPCFEPAEFLEFLTFPSGCSHNVATDHGSDQDSDTTVTNSAALLSEFDNEHSHLSGFDPEHSLLSGFDPEPPLSSGFDPEHSNDSFIVTDLFELNSCSNFTAFDNELVWENISDVMTRMNPALDRVRIIEHCRYLNVTNPSSDLISEWLSNNFSSTWYQVTVDIYWCPLYEDDILPVDYFKTWDSMCDMEKYYALFCIIRDVSEKRSGFSEWGFQFLLIGMLHGGSFGDHIAKLFHTLNLPDFCNRYVFCGGFLRDELRLFNVQHPLLVNVWTIIYRLFDENISDWSAFFEEAANLESFQQMVQTWEVTEGVLLRVKTDIMALESKVFTENECECAIFKEIVRLVGEDQVEIRFWGRSSTEILHKDEIENDRIAQALYDFMIVGMDLVL